MAFGNPVTLTGVPSKTGTTLAITGHVSTAPVGSLAVVAVISDNAGTTDAAGADNIVGVTDTAGNTYTLAHGYRNGQGAAQAGAHASVWYSVLTTAITPSVTVTVTSTNAAYARYAHLHYYTVGAGNTVTVAGVANGVGDAGVDPVSTISGLPGSTQYLWVGCVADEGTAVPAAPAGFAALGGMSTSGGQAALNVAGRVFWVIDTGQTTKTLTPATAGDAVSVLVAFKEGAPLPARTGSMAAQETGSDTAAVRRQGHCQRHAGGHRDRLRHRPHRGHAGGAADHRQPRGSGGWCRHSRS